MVKNLPAMQETRARSLGWEDPLENDMTIHSSILRESHGQRSLAGYSPWGHKESDTTERLTHILFLQKKKSHWDFDRDCIESILLGSDILILNLLTMSMICVSTIL